MRQIITTIDPQTYGFSRTPIALGLVAAAVVAGLCVKLLAVLHAAGLPVAS